MADLIWKVASVSNRSRFRSFPGFDGFNMEKIKFDSEGNLVEEPVAS